MKIRMLFMLALLVALALVFTVACDDDDDDDDNNDDTDVDDDTTPDDDATPDDDTGDDDTAPDDDATPDDDTGDNDTGDDDTGDDDTGDDDTTPMDCPAVITREPYLQLATSTSMAVRWWTDEEGDSLVEYGPTPDLGNYEVDHELTYKHELVIEGLEPGTTYYYKARSCLDETTVASFRTAPEGNTPFNFVAFGDNQAGWETFTEIADMMTQEDPWMVLSVGDIVDDGWNLPDWEQQLFGPAEELLRSAPIYVSIGNHEAMAPYFFEAFHFPNGQKLYYSFTFGNVFFLALALDTIHPCLPGMPQHDYMIEALSSDEAQNAEFRIVFFHTPPWTEGWEGYNGEELVRLFVVPHMEKYNVDIYFNGHTHDFERGLRNGVTNYIIGGAGGNLDTWARDVPHITVYHSIHHYMSIQVDDKTMTLEAINLDGEVFDTYQIIH